MVGSVADGEGIMVPEMNMVILCQTPMPLVLWPLEECEETSLSLQCSVNTPMRLWILKDLEAAAGEDMGPGATAEEVLTEAAEGQ